jgi:hemoglobin
VYYAGRDVKLSHQGVRINRADWDAFMKHVNATLDGFNLPATERSEVVAFITSTRGDIVEA